MEELALDHVLAGPDSSTVVGDDDISMSRTLNQNKILVALLFPAGENVRISSYRKASHTPPIDGYDAEGGARVSEPVFQAKFAPGYPDRDWAREDGMCWAKSGRTCASVIRSGE